MSRLLGDRRARRPDAPAGRARSGDGNAADAAAEAAGGESEQAHERETGHGHLRRRVSSSVEPTRSAPLLNVGSEPVPADRSAHRQESGLAARNTTAPEAGDDRLEVAGAECRGAPSPPRLTTRTSMSTQNNEKHPEHAQKLEDLSPEAKELTPEEAAAAEGGVYTKPVMQGDTYTKLLGLS